MFLHLVWDLGVGPGMGLGAVLVESFRAWVLPRLRVSCKFFGMLVRAKCSSLLVFGRE